MSGVSADGDVARVQGKVASYRVHLGSAAIHIEPGNYLCIVPDSKAKNERGIFLPFGDSGDDKIAEIVSKILLLSQDDQIKEQSILRQIRFATASS